MTVTTATSKNRVRCWHQKDLPPEPVLWHQGGAALSDAPRERHHLTPAGTQPHRAVPVLAGTAFAYLAANQGIVESNTAGT